MLRIRFHGRGGHGVKTASRILGTAAFRSGWQAQDFPLFGAERRGAPISAFTRIDESPILERGIIRNPDLILIADETLLTDKTAGVLLGQETASVVFVNSSRSPEEIAGQMNITCPVLARDLTTAALEVLGRGSALSTPLGAVACALTNRIHEDHLEYAVQEELGELSLPEEIIDKNILFAKEVFHSIPAIPLSSQKPAAFSPGIHRPAFDDTVRGVPVMFHTGNSALRHTGSWRLFAPSIDHAACTRCQICLVRCPDGVISLDAEGYPVIDYDNCKGCMLCQQECPVHCIHEKKEVRAW